MNFKLVNKVVYRICDASPQTTAKILGVSVSDLFAEGNLGLWKAYKTFESENNKWSTYAAICIRNEVAGFLRKSNVYNDYFRSVELEMKYKISYVELGYLTCRQKAHLEMIEKAHPALTVKQKQLFQLFYIDGMPQSVAKDIMGMSQPACSQLHKRMVNVIKKEVEKQLGG